MPFGQLSNSGDRVPSQVFGFDSPPSDRPAPLSSRLDESRDSPQTRPVLHYETVAPSSADCPYLMIVLHGLGDSLEGYRWLPGALNCPRLKFALVNAPEHYYGGYSWYDIHHESLTGVERSRDLLLELLEHFREQGVPSRSTFLFGFSQGCLMTWEIGVNCPHLLAGCIGISGYARPFDKLWAAPSPRAKEQRFFVTHGQSDPLIPIEPVRRQVEELKNRGLQIEWQEYPKQHTIAEFGEIDAIREFVLQRQADLDQERPAKTAIPSPDPTPRSD